MSATSKKTVVSSGLNTEERNGKVCDHTAPKSKSAVVTVTRKNSGGCVANGSLLENDSLPNVSMRERTASIEQRKQSTLSQSASSKSRAEALLSRKVTGSATSVRTPAQVASRPPKGPRRSTSSDKVQVPVGAENGYISGQTQEQLVPKPSGIRPKREASSTSSSSSSEGDEKGLKIQPGKKTPIKSSGPVDEMIKKPWGSGPGNSKTATTSKSKTPPSARRKSSPPSAESMSRFQRQSSLRSSQNGTSLSLGRKPSSRTPSNSSLDSGLSPTNLTESDGRKLRNGTAKSSSEDSISDTERKTKSGLSRTPSAKRRVCMEIVMEKKIISHSNGAVAGKADSGLGKSPSKHSLSSLTDDNANPTRTSPTKAKSVTAPKSSTTGAQTGARRKVKSVPSDASLKHNGASNADRSRGVSAPVLRRTDNSLPGISPGGPLHVRAKSGVMKISDAKPNLKSPDRGRVMSKGLLPQRSRARAKSMEPVARRAPVMPVIMTIDLSSACPDPTPENTSTTTTTATTTIIRARRSQSVERRGNRDSFVASRRQAWEDKALQPPPDTKKSPPSPEKRFQRGGPGRRSLIDERKAMLFGTRGQIRGAEVVKKPVIPNKPENISSKPSVPKVDRRDRIELFINEDLPAPNSDTKPVSDVTKPAVLQENVQKVQHNAINLIPSKIPLSSDEVDSALRFSSSKENEINSVANAKMYPQRPPAVDNQEYGDALEKWSMLKGTQSIEELGNKKREDLRLDNKEAESRRQALLEFSNRELETSNHNRQIIEAGYPKDCPPEAKDGHYYQRIVNEEQARLESLSAPANKDLEKELSEEACGKLRASIGKAYLLTNKKFKQFRGLCEQNINPAGGKVLSVTNLDLTGFWEMVLIQVDDVNSMFAEIEVMRHNGWRTPQPSPQKTKSTYKRQPSMTSPPPSPGVYKPTNHPLTPVDPRAKAEREKKAAKARQAREEARRRLMAAKKAAARKRLKSEEAGEEPPPVGVEIFVPDKP